ncbi:MAG TPA: hypothetical protein PKN33_11145 [Phycisphaerae bacterium]|nr:hypothetical protein [Phycisphaerae bacterium]
MYETTVEYFSNAKGGKWPKRLVAEFGEYLKSNGGFEFTKGSDEDSLFRSKLRNVGVTSGIDIRCAQESLEAFRYFYLFVETHDSLRPWDFMLAGSGCLTEESPLCWIGSVQEKRIHVDERALGGMDLVSPDFLTSPAIIVVSKRCKNLLQRLGVTGCRFEACDAKTNAPISIDASPNSPGSAINGEDAAFYQLNITEVVAKPPCFGKVLSLEFRCPKCGAAGGCRATNMVGEFDLADLSEADFQTYHGFCDDEGRLYHHKVERIIVSSRVLQALVHEGMKGLIEWGSDPMFYHAVSIRE